MSSSTVLLEAVDVRKEFDTDWENIAVLKGVSFKITKGPMHFIVGRSGSGKSTLLQLMGGLDKPTSGKIFFEGQDLTKLSDAKISRLRNHRIGFVFQFYHLLPELTLYENVLLPSMMYGKPDHSSVREILTRVGLLTRKHHYPSQLSGGEKQRTAIARALVNRPSIVLCDEPTGNLDQETAESVFTLMEDLNKKDGICFVVVTHDETLAARHHHVYRMQDGILTKQDAVEKDTQPAVKK